MNKFKTIGIIGGQGPVSTADMYMRIIKYCQDHFGARFIRDYPPMIIFSVPTPDLVKTIADEKTTFISIAKAIKKLEHDGCDFIIIACNSLQYLINKLQPLIKIPIIGIAPIVTKYVQKKGYKTVGMLASDTVVKKGVYTKQLHSIGVKVITPNDHDQVIVEDIILNEIGGNVSTEDERRLTHIIFNLQRQGAESVLLACTELPLFIKQTDVIEIPLIDCNELYAQETAKYSRKV